MSTPKFLQAYTPSGSHQVQNFLPFYSKTPFTPIKPLLRPLKQPFSPLMLAPFSPDVLPLHYEIWQNYPPRRETPAPRTRHRSFFHQSRQRHRAHPSIQYAKKSAPRFLYGASRLGNKISAQRPSPRCRAHLLHRALSIGQRYFRSTPTQR